MLLSFYYLTLCSQIIYQDGWHQSDIINIKPPNRPDPQDYLVQCYIDWHHLQFQNGASKIITQQTLDRFGTDKIGPPSGQFVIPSHEMDQILATQNLAYVADSLGVPLKYWENQLLLRIDIQDVDKYHIRIPSGNELGVNELWIPGGKLKSGIVEGVIDQVSNYTMNQINLYQ